MTATRSDKKWLGWLMALTATVAYSTTAPAAPVAPRIEIFKQALVK